MSQDPLDEEALRALRDAARIAAPSTPTGEHLDDASLARLRAGEDDESLDDGYRHLASCTVCRARMTDEDAGRALVALAPVVPLAPRRKRSWTWAALAAAALVAVMVFFVVRAKPTEPLAISQRSFVGTMGSGPAPSVAPRDRNVEIAIDTKVEAASVIVCDAQGARLFGPEKLTPDERGRLSIVVAPRTFPAHAGGERAFVFAGSAMAVQETLHALGEGTPLDAGRAAAIARDHDARFSVVTLID